MPTVSALTERGYKPKVDWFRAKIAYLENPNFSYTDIARMFGVSLKQVKVHGAHEDWVEGRQRVADFTEQRID